MSETLLLRLLSSAAIAGGLLRVIAALVPWTPQSAPLEIFYGVIDVLLLFGLMGVYFAFRARLGLFGFVAFAIGETGIASIVGPDTVAFGIDTYLVGVHVITLGITLFAVQLLLTRSAPWWVPAFWLVSTVVGVGAAALGDAALGFAAGGVLFGFGFMAAGAAAFSAAAPST